jgi:exonuclease III
LDISHGERSERSRLVIEGFLDDQITSLTAHFALHQAMFDILEADIVVMQETKIQRKDLTDDMVLVPGWDVYFSLPKHKKGTS